MAASKLQSFWNHPAGPKTIFFWAPTVKWGISIANVVDFSEPAERISYPQQVGSGLVPDFLCRIIKWMSYHISSAALMCTGLIYSRFSMVITP
ncbi:mitochondrial pyruvate carrier 4, partial [Quercus suber]